MARKYVEKQYQWFLQQGSSTLSNANPSDAFTVLADPDGTDVIVGQVELVRISWALSWRFADMQETTLVCPFLEVGLSIQDDATGVAVSDLTVSTDIDDRWIRREYVRLIEPGSVTLAGVFGQHVDTWTMKPPRRLKKNQVFFFHVGWNRPSGVGAADDISVHHTMRILYR